MARSDSEVLLAPAGLHPCGRSRAAPLASAELADFLVGVRPGMSGLMTLGLPSESELVEART